MARQTKGLFDAFGVLSRGFIGRECVWTAAITSCLAYAGMASTASGASFGVNLIDAGGVVGGSLGSPITWSPANAAYNPGAGSDLPPSPNSVFALPSLKYDSYVALDAVGPTIESSTTSSNDGYQAMGPTNILRPTATPSTVFGPGSLSGIWFSAGANGGFVTSTNHIFERHHLMIAQITLRADTSEPTTAGVLVNIRDAGTINPDGELGALRFGEANASNNSGKWGQSYYLHLVARPITPPINPVLGGTSYAIYVVAVPGPGTTSFAGLAGLLTVRRRSLDRSGPD